MGELDESLLRGRSNADGQPPREGSPYGIVLITILLLVALIVWYRFK